MKGTLVASRYAKSLLDLSIEQNSVEKVNNDMVSLSEICAESKDFVNLLNNPIIHTTKKVDVFKALFNGKMEAISVDFLNLITKNNRANILPSIADSFIKLYKAHKGVVDVIITSAESLDADTKSKILDKIKSSIKDGEVLLVEKIDPTLLGGFIVNIEDKQIDASVASQLTNLKNILLN
ncbi:MAG: ATP synthase F1 subunit delta [Crocinitomicaceae bacterium]